MNCGILPMGTREKLRLLSLFVLVMHSSSLEEGTAAVEVELQQPNTSASSPS